MKRWILAFASLLAAVLLYAGPAGAIVNGQLDGNLHPEVGALIAEYVQPGEKDVLCSGTLIAPTVFLTAAHCTDFLASLGITDVWVTFDSQFTSSSTLIHGSYVTDPAYNAYAGAGGSSDPHDLAVVLLDTAPSITPAQLPTAGLLNKTDLDDGAERVLLRFDAPLRRAVLPFARARLAQPLREPLDRQRRDLLRRLGRPALPRWGDQQPRSRDHRHRRRSLPRDRQDLPARHTVGPRLPRPVRHATVAVQRRPRAKRGLRRFTLWYHEGRGSAALRECGNGEIRRAEKAHRR